MSFLELAKQAEARLRATREPLPGNEIARSNEGSPGRRPDGAPYFVPSCNFVGQSSFSDALPFLSMPLDEFKRRGARLEVRVPWLNVTLWVVPVDRDVNMLLQEGISRGRIWTANELQQLMSVASRTPETVQTLAHAKLELDGDIIKVRQRRPESVP